MVGPLSIVQCPDMYYNDVMGKQDQHNYRGTLELQT